MSEGKKKEGGGMRKYQAAGPSEGVTSDAPVNTKGWSRAERKPIPSKYNTPEEAEYYNFKKHVEKARQAIGTQDEKTLKELADDGYAYSSRGYNSNDLARDFKTLVNLRKDAGFDTAKNLYEDTAINLPHIGQQMRGAVNSMFQTNFKAGGRKVPGGEVIQLPGGAVEFKGNKHFESGNGSDSGIILEKSTATKQGIEVEDGETMDKVNFKAKAGGSSKEVKDDYIFSSYLKMGGRSFADRHKDILKKGGSQKQIQELAKLQEEKAKQVGETPVGPTDQYGPRGKEYIARYGGVKPRMKAQTDGGIMGRNWFPEAYSTTDVGLGYERPDYQIFSEETGEAVGKVLQLPFDAIDFAKGMYDTPGSAGPKDPYNITQVSDANIGLTPSFQDVTNRLRPVLPTEPILPTDIQRELNPEAEQQAQQMTQDYRDEMQDYKEQAEVYNYVARGGETPTNLPPLETLLGTSAVTDDSAAPTPATETTEVTETAETPEATGTTRTTGTTSTTSSQGQTRQTTTEPGVEYEDALITQDGVQYSTEDFKRKGRGSSIDYSGDVNAGSWEDVLNTNWAENLIGDREVTSQEELQKIYNDEYVPQVESFFENNPEQAYDAIVNFALSGNPNAANLKKKIFKDGKLLPEDEVLSAGLKNATDGKVGTFHSLFTGAPKQELQPMTPIDAVEVPQVDIEKSIEVPEEVKDTLPKLMPPKVRDIPPLAYLGAASQALGPAMALATEYDQPERVSPGVVGKERLARVNYNAERAANANATTAANRYTKQCSWSCWYSGYNCEQQKSGRTVFKNC